jgi:Uma2 family endonuclease
LLQKYAVPYYWVIWPEDRVLIVYQLSDGKYAVTASVENGGKARLQPFAELEFDLDYVFGMDV